MTIHKLPTWVLKRMIEICRSWLWNGDNLSNNGGKRRVAWNLICRPKHLGGLGVLDLTKFGRALRLRWLWMAWQRPPWPWAGTPLPCSNEERQLSAMATEITIGDGKRANFWHDRWLQGSCPKTIAPSLFAISTRKNCSVCEALKDETWLHDLARGLSEHMVPELTDLAARISHVVLLEDQPDIITWRFANDHEYSARSAYRLQFEGSITMDGYKLIWSSWAPGKCRFFIWTVMLGRILMADALLRRGWENDYFCPLCERNLETPSHLFIECPWSRVVWDSFALLAEMPALTPAAWTGQSTFSTWMQRCYDTMVKVKQRGLMSLIHLIT